MDNMNDKQMRQLAQYVAEDLTKRIYGIANPGNERNDMMWYADRDLSLIHISEPTRRS